MALHFLLCGTTAGAVTAEQACESSDFRDVVAAASATISHLHERNSTVFQQGLQKLRAVNNWSDAEYLAKATPFVKDDITRSLDAANQALLAKIQSLEAANAGTKAGRCEMLNELKTSMQQVVINTAAKWQHMLSKVERASAEPLQAGFTR